MKIYLPVSTDSNDSVKRGYAMDLFKGFTGLDVAIDEMGDSHADRACNKMANAFLKTDCDAMFVIDCDIRFRRVDVEKMIANLERGLKAVWGIYPKKHEQTEPCVCTFAEIPAPDEYGLVTVRRSGRGFMIVTREVFERLKEENGGPARRYDNHGEEQWSFFRSGVVDGQYSALQANQWEWISEDWMFCEDLRIHLGIPTLVDTSIALGHIGSKAYWFKADQLIRMDSNISSWRDIHGWFDYEDLYRELAQRIPDGGKFAEVGCWLGRSLGAFNAFAREAGKSISLVAVDTFQGAPVNGEQAAILEAHGGNVEKVFRANMAALGLNEELTVIAGDSADSASQIDVETLDAVFIDASHEEKDVLRDIRAWFPKIKERGVVCGHDYDKPGVAAAVWRCFGLSSRFQIENSGRCWVVNV